MKKSLSVLLAGALAFGSFASLASAADLSTADKYKELVDKGILKGTTTGSAQLDDKLTRAQFATIAAAVAGLTPATTGETFSDVKKGQWWYGAIEAAAKAGLVNGTGAGKFSPRADVTVESVIKVAATLAGEKPVEGATVTGASVWAAPYIQAALDAGLISNRTDYKSFATRGQTIDIVYNAYVDSQAPKVVSAKVVDSKNVEVTMSDKEVVKVVLETALEANKETEITFKYKDKEYKTKVTWVITAATKVEAVEASNLKEIVVKFDGEVDKATAGDAGNYTLNGGLTVKSATVADDLKSVILVVNGKMNNQTDYKLTFNNVKAGAAIISAKDTVFTPVDAALPVAESAQALGNKTIKLTFSEPIQAASAANLKIDGTPVVGFTTTNDSSTVIVKVYSALTNAEHTITVQGVQDFAGFKSKSTDLKFAVVEDKAAPTVAAVEKATFEKVTLKFSEPVDPATVLATNVYWLSGSSKQYAGSVSQLSDDSFEFDFSSRKIQYTLDLYVTGVKDYSGNAIASDTKVSVSPVLDQVRPEVVNAELNKARNEFTVKFSKVVDEAAAVKSANYVVKDADGKEVSKLKEATLQSDKKTVKVTLSSALSEGESYTLEVSGVSDTTTLKNVMMPFSKTFDVTDASGPDSSKISAEWITDNGTNRIVITFPEVMAVTGDGSIVDKTKYLYSKDGTNYQPLPDNTGINITPDGKSVILSVPTADLHVDDVKKVRVSLVKDTTGNYISNYLAEPTVAPAAAPKVASVKATETDKISVTFNLPLLSNTVAASDFRVYTSNDTLTVVAADLDSDSKTVKLTLSEATELSENGTYEGDEVTAEVTANPSVSTPAGKAAVGKAVAADKIAATVDKIEGSTDGKTATIFFNEALKTGLDANAATDLLIKDKDGNILNPSVYTVSSNANKLVVTFNAAQKGIMEITVQNPRFIQDAKGNIVKSSDAIEFVVKK